jgi:hypothetical protein
MRFDFVTVGFGPDLALLRLQARSMGRFLDAGAVGQVLVVENGAEGPLG